MEPIADYAGFEAFLGRFTNYERFRSMPYDPHALGTRRMLAFASRLGDPHLSCPAIHVAGSKGKGATCLILEAVLRGHGLRVGTYLSPHVEHLTERIRVDGRPVEAAELVAETNSILTVLERLREEGPDAYPSFFELMTGLAMGLFRRQQVDWGIFEVGLGGRLDATNILRPACCAITSIELEHTEQLGNTLASVAREKAGIIKPGVPVVLGPLVPEAEEEILRIARERGAETIPFDPRLVSPEDGGRIRLRDPAVACGRGPVVGPAMRANLSIALSVLRRVLPAAAGGLDAARTAAAIEALELPARVELVRGAPPAIVDGAHTPRAIAALRTALEEMGFPRPRTLLFSLAEGKDVERILPELPALAESVVFTRADPVRSIPPGELRARAGFGTVEESPEEALRIARAAGRAIVVTGSFYLAGRLRPLLRRSVSPTP